MTSAMEDDGGHPRSYISVHRYPPAKTASNPDRQSKTTSSEYFSLGVVILIFSALVWLICLALKTLVPPVSVKFRVNDISVFPFNVSDSPFSDWKIRFTVENPSNKTINYDSAQVFLFYGYTHHLSYGNISPFSQSGNDETVVEAGLKGASLQVDDEVLKSITMDMSALGAVEFQVYVDGFARVEPGTDKEKSFGVVVDCEHTKIEFISNTTTVVGRLVGGSRKCRVRQ